MPEWFLDVKKLEELWSSKIWLPRFPEKDLPAGMAILQASVTAKELFQDLVPWQHLGLTSSSDDQLE